MIDSELTQTCLTFTSDISPSTILIAGVGGAEELSQQLQAKGLECCYVYLAPDDDTTGSSFTYQQLAPVLAQAQEEGLQLVIAANPEEHKLSIAIRKHPQGPFQLLSVHQLSVLLADYLSDQSAEEGFACLRSVVMTDMLEKMLLRKNCICLTEVLVTESLPEAAAALLANTGAAEQFAVAERGEFWSNKGFSHLVERLIELHQAQAEQEQSLFNKLLALYTQWGFYKEKVLAVALTDPKQAEHYKRLISYFRSTKTATMASYAISEIRDYKQLKLKNFLTGKQVKLTNKPVDMLKVTFTEGISLMFVPTADRMFMYLSLSGKLMSREEFATLGRTFDQKLMRLIELVNKL